MKDNSKLLGIVIMGMSIPMIFVSAYLGIITGDMTYSYGVGLFFFSSFMGYFTYSILSVCGNQESRGTSKQ